MKSLSEKMLVRRQKDRPKSTVTLKLPTDIVQDLCEMAPVMGFGSQEALIRGYISDGLRRHEARIDEPDVRILLDSLKRHGVADDVITEVLAETLQKSA